MLPTGYGKIFVYEITPIILSVQQKSCFVIVVEPLNVVIHQQLLELGSSATCLTDNISEVELEKLRCGQYTYIYTHPENIIGKKHLNKIFTSSIYDSKICIIVLDEAHCVLDWGEDYRPMFRELKQLRAILPHAKILALSATLTVKQK